MFRPQMSLPLARAAGSAWGLVARTLAISAMIAAGSETAAAEAWLRATASIEADSITVTLTNDSSRPLHGLDNNRWGRNNFVKVGLGVRPLGTPPGPPLLESRPDLDGQMVRVKWTKIDVGPDGLPPGAATTVRLPYAALTRGHVDLVVLGRKQGHDWLTLREPLLTQLWIEGDAWRTLAGGFTLAVGWFCTRRPKKAVFGSRAVLLHTICVSLGAVALIVQLDAIHYREFPHSDGANYAVIARSVSEGRGLVSPIIQPGLTHLARTEANQQAFIIQAPGWPLLLAQSFRLWGASPRVSAVTGYALVAATTVLVFWLGALSARGAWAGYLSAGLSLSGPWVFGPAVTGSNAPLQSLMISALFLLLFRPPTVGTMALAGLISGVGLVVRETMLFAVAAFLLAAWWYHGDRARVRTQGRALAAFLIVLAIPWLADRSRRAAVSSAAPFPTVTATLLYGTAQTDTRWYWREGAAWTRVHPIAYLAAHPDELLSKVRSQFRETFLRDTVPKLFSFAPLLLPFLWPALIAREHRAAATATTLSLLLLTVGGCVAFLHPSYFHAFLPAMAASVAGGIDGLLRRIPSHKGVRPVLLLAVAYYALLPLSVNLEAIGRPGSLELGDYVDNPTTYRQLGEFVARETPEGALIAVAHHPAPRLAWYVRRSFLQYDPNAELRIGPTAMWESILRRTPADYILLTSFMDRGDEPLPEGFELRATISESGLKAWLFARSAEGSGSPG